MIDDALQDMRPHWEATWSAVIRSVQAVGGAIEKTESGYALVRTVGTLVLLFPLPIDFDPNQPDKSMPPSPFTLDSIKRNLDVALPFYPVL